MTSIPSGSNSRTSWNASLNVRAESSEIVTFPSSFAQRHSVLPGPSNLNRYPVGAQLVARFSPKALWWPLRSFLVLFETRAAAPLIAALRQARPGLRLLLTHGTATGRAAGQALLRDGDLQAWLPWDTPGGVRRFLDHFAPALGVLMETEIWPNLLAEAKARGVPMMLANARLSERSRRRGQRVDALLRPAFESLAAASRADRGRRRAPARRRRRRRAASCGNLKFDLAPDAALIERGRRWKAAAGARPVRARGGHARGRGGEPARGLARASPRRGRCCVVVPRHPQRFDEVAALIVAAGFSAVAAQRLGRGAARGRGRGRRLARRLDARDAGSTTRSPTSPCSAAASRRSAART